MVYLVINNLVYHHAVKLSLSEYCLSF